MTKDQNDALLNIEDAALTAINNDDTVEDISTRLIHLKGALAHIYQTARNSQVLSVEDRLDGLEQAIFEIHDRFSTPRNA